MTHHKHIDSYIDWQCNACADREQQMDIEKQYELVEQSDEAMEQIK